MSAKTTTQQEYVKKPLPGKVKSIGIGLLGFGLVLSIAAFASNSLQASYNSLIIFMFLMSIGIGSLFLVAIEHLAGAIWSTPLRRVLELNSYIIRFLPLFVLPILINFTHMYEWTDPEVVAQSKFLQSKEPYLNITAFAIRNIAIYLIWFFFQWAFTKNSLAQDSTKDQSYSAKNVKLAAAFLPFFALGVTVMAIDWVMSLEAEWFSTMFGVYYFAGTTWSALAVSAISVVLLKENGYLHPKMVKDHYYSIGGLMFAFTIFWSYIALGQLLIIYSANIPEETFWYLHRWDNEWKYASLALIVLHFLVPFFALLSRPAKVNKNRLILVSVWVLATHIYDLYWLVAPVLHKTGPKVGWTEIGFPIMAVGFVITLFSIVSKNMNLVPIGDPKLERGLHFRL